MNPYRENAESKQLDKRAKWGISPLPDRWPQLRIQADIRRALLSETYELQIQATLGGEPMNSEGDCVAYSVARFRHDHCTREQFVDRAMIALQAVLDLALDHPKGSA